MKKLLAVIAAVSVALTLVGCDMLAAKAGKGNSSGTKNNKTIEVDATKTLATCICKWGNMTTLSANTNWQKWNISRATTKNPSPPCATTSAQRMWECTNTPTHCRI